MIEIGHGLNYGIIAEGVETLGQLEELQALGCQTVQGYYLAKPMNSNELINYITYNLNQ